MTSGKTVSHEITIDLPPETVWNNMRDLTLATYYVPGVVETWLVTQQREGVGASRKVRMKNGDVMDETVVEWTEGRGFVVRLHKGDKPALPAFRECSFRYAIEPAGDRTLFRPAMHFTPAPGIRNGLIGMIAGFAMKSMVKKVGAAMKRFYEAGGKPGT